MSGNSSCRALASLTPSSERAGPAGLASVLTYAATAQRQNCVLGDGGNGRQHHDAAMPPTSNLFRSRTVYCDAKGRNFQNPCTSEPNFLEKIHK